MPDAASPITGLEMHARQLRDLNIRAESFNAETRTLDVVFSTGARRAMFDWNSYREIDEELAVTPEAMRLDRLNAGAPVLNTHKSFDLEDVIGVVVPGSARIEGGAAIATLQLSARESIAEIVADIEAGIIRNISVGYIVHAYEITERTGERPLYRAVDWEPAEISFVPVPADPAAGVRSADAAQGRFPCIIRRANSGPANLEPTMPIDNDPVVPAAVIPPASSSLESRSALPATVTATAIITAARNANLAQPVIDELVARHDETPMTRTDMMAAIGEQFAARAAPPTNGRVTVTRDEGDTTLQGIVNAMEARAGVAALNENGRRFRSRQLLMDVAKRMWDVRGVSYHSLNDGEIMTRALGMTTSDLPNIVANVMGKVARQRYEQTLPSYMMWARRASNLRDFKPRSAVQLSGAPDLLPLGEAGEVKVGSWSDQAASYRAMTYARKTVLSRQVLINDDLELLTDSIAAYADAARRLENRLVYQALASNGTYLGGNLFSAGNGNLAGAGAAIGLTTLAAGRAAMRAQKGLAGELINVPPAFLLVPGALETVGEQFVASTIVPNTNGNVNQFGPGGRTSLQLVVEPELDAYSLTAWYLAAEMVRAAIEYAFLDGAEGVQIAQRDLGGFAGVEIEAGLDFAVGVIDHRPVFRNPGA